MPIVQSSYRPPTYFRNYHVSTIYASLARTIEIPYERERVELPDGDFIDLDWSYTASRPSRKLLVSVHGLGGHSGRPYMTGLSRLFNRSGWDVAAINLRGCSGEINRLYRSYHAGASEDLEMILSHISRNRSYDTLALNGFSLGGNILLKYLGEERIFPNELKAAVAISAPCDLYHSLSRLDRYVNSIYSLRFVRVLKAQLSERQRKFPEKLRLKDLQACKTLYSIDELYTSKAHGFQNALDYYNKSSSLNYLSNIQIPTLLLNAKNDGFLSASSSPLAMASESNILHLEMPAYGGHVGFLQDREETYAEERALEFIQGVL